MRCVLVDTSVWVDHFRHHNDALADLLGLDRVMIHPMVLGELACGTPPSRARTLADLGRLESTQQANVREVIAFLDREQLFGLGCGLVDISLLASTLLTNDAALWTLDRRLAELADRFGVRYQPKVAS